MMDTTAASPKDLEAVCLWLFPRRPTFQAQAEAGKTASFTRKHLPLDFQLPLAQPRKNHRGHYQDAYEAAQHSADDRRRQWLHHLRSRAMAPQNG